MPASGQTNLPAMSVSTQLQFITQGGGFGIGFGAVRQEDYKCILRSFLTRSCQIMRLEIVWVVHPGDPQGISAAPDFSRFIEKDRESIALEFQDHFKRIMVSEDAPAVRRQSLAKVRHCPRRGLMLTGHTIPVIPGEHSGIMCGLFYQIDDERHEVRIQIAVQVGELQKAKAFKRRRQVRKKPLLFLQTNIQKIRPHPLFDASKAKDVREPQIERKHSLEAENASPLMNKLRELVVLSLEPLGVKLLAQAGFER
jgi:hypothetical protein